MAAPTTLTFTLADGVTTFAVTIPTGKTASQVYQEVVNSVNSPCPGHYSPDGVNFYPIATGIRKAVAS